MDFFFFFEIDDSDSSDDENLGDTEEGIYEGEVSGRRREKGFKGFFNAAR